MNKNIRYKFLQIDYFIIFSVSGLFNFLMQICHFFVFQNLSLCITIQCFHNEQDIHLKELIYFYTEPSKLN